MPHATIRFLSTTLNAESLVEVNNYKIYTPDPDNPQPVLRGRDMWGEFTIPMTHVVSIQERTP